jgi:hypothetical protein
MLQFHDYRFSIILIYALRAQILLSNAFKWLLVSRLPSALGPCLTVANKRVNPLTLLFKASIQLVLRSQVILATSVQPSKFPCRMKGMLAWLRILNHDMTDMPARKPATR